VLEKRDPCRWYAVISCDAVDVDRLADRLAMWIDDEGLYNAQANPRPQRSRSHPAATSLDRNVLEGLDPVPVCELTHDCVKVHALNDEIDERKFSPYGAQDYCHAGRRSDG
jgi:hypothetical protein